MTRIRTFHRWTSYFFVLTTIVTFAVLMLNAALDWVSYVPLLPLALLMITGICMWFVPYLAKRRAERAAS